MARRARRSKRDDWEKMRQSMTGEFAKTKGVEGREIVPDKACGKCESFAENAYATDGRGFCASLKVGSDLLSDPPVFITEGDVGMMCMFNMDAARCTYYKEAEYIDTHGAECNDPKYGRQQRQMEKAKSKK